MNLFMLLNAHASDDKKCYLMKHAKSNFVTKIYSAESFDSYINIKLYILVLHALTGCNTTLALFVNDKAIAFRINFRYGIQCFIAFYDTPSGEASNDHHRWPSRHVLIKMLSIQRGMFFREKIFFILLVEKPVL